MTGSSEIQRSDDELRHLIDKVISGSIQADEFQQLETRLKSDPAARHLYLADLEIESLLSVKQSNSKSTIFPKVSHSLSPNRNLTGRFWAGLMLAAILMLGAGLLKYGYQNAPLETPSQIVTKPENRQRENSPRQSKIQKKRSVARITNSQDATWQSAELLIGSWLKPDTYRLDLGDAEITFDAGAIVWITAGSEFEIINANGIRLIEGSLEADVPEQAIGFKVETPTGEITDLSTRFSVNVSSEGSSEVHVQKGLVEARPNSLGDSQVLTLKENTAMRMFANAPPKQVEFSKTVGFQFGSRSSRGALEYLHFSFDQPAVSNGIVPNNEPGGNGVGGTIVDKGIENSWLQVDGKIGKALYFSGEGAKIKTPIKGISESSPRTVMFWVRINPETPIENAYSFVAWGDPEKNGKKWQIGWHPNYVKTKGGILGAVRTEFGGGYVIGSTDLRDGRWHHVTSVFVGGRNTDVATSVRHYVDAKLESVSAWKSSKRINTESEQHAIVLGEYIGHGKEFFETYKGWIDEFYLFDVALTPNQIVQIMEKNQPPVATDVVLPPNSKSNSKSNSTNSTNSKSNSKSNLKSNSKSNSK